MSNESSIKKFLPGIFDMEAKGIMLDLIGSPVMMAAMMFATKAQVNVVGEYITGVIEECYRTGGLKVLGYNNEDTLYGYAILTGQPKLGPMLYCHKIFVFEAFRGHGVGTQLLSGVLNMGQPVGLLCREKLIPFYESAGMKNKGLFNPPDGAGFDKTRDMYTGLFKMASCDECPDGMPVFMLNDRDVENMITTMLACNS